MQRTLVLAVALFSWSHVASGADQEGDASRVALVIGNSAYQEAPLRNPANDARAMSRRLAALGFEVISVENAGRDAMQKAILEFASRLREESIGLFYYAGHGIQSRGRNYLLPVNARVENERALRFQAMEVQTVLEEMEYAGNRMNIVILDACRNNPFERRFRGGSRGLAAIDAARGTLIAYATAPGAVAADGDGANGLYTAELLRALTVPDLKAEEVFKRVRVAVSERSSGAQVPWESSSLTGDFVFNRSKAPATVAAPARTGGHEALFWETIKDSENADDFRAYLDQFPQGTFASLAHIRLSALENDVSRTADPAQASDGKDGSAEVRVATAVGSAGAASKAAVAPADPPEELKVALLPFDGWHRYGYLPEALNKLEKGIKSVIRSDRRLVLVYAHNHRAGGRMGGPERFWSGSTYDKKPKREQVFAAGDKLGADIVLTYFFKRSANNITTVEAYLFDVRSGKVVNRDVTFTVPSGQPKELTRELINELFSGQ